ncbi:MAG TPA: cytochrome c [Pseudolabrys sp.]|nr:cytochrome c [Pseudolabrys sp.]
MFTRIVAAVLIAGLGFGTVMAQQDPVKTREDLMKKNNEHAKSVVQMMRGQAPFDAAAVDAAFRQWADTAQVLPSLFPENSKTGGDSRASPKIWADKKDFDDKAAAFGKAVKENHDKAKSSLDGLKAAIPVVGKTCDDCHKDYRLSKQ